MNETILKTLASEPKNHLKKITILLIVLSISLWSLSSIEYKGIMKNGLEITKNIILSLFSPDTSFLFNLTNQGVPYLLLETIAIAFLGTLIGAIISIPFAFLASRNITPKYVSAFGSLVIAFIRSFPAIIYGLLFIKVTGPGPFAGVLTLSFTSIGMVSKLYIEAIEDLDMGIIEAMDASGLSLFKKIRFGILPQISTNILSTAIYRFEINLKDASILGLVGAGGIGAPLIFAMNSQKWDQVGAILIGIILLVLIVEYFSTKMRAKLA